MSLDLLPNAPVVSTPAEARHIYPRQHSNHQDVEHFPPSHLDDQVRLSSIKYYIKIIYNIKMGRIGLTNS
jgi:hypothetical protein